MRKRSELLFNLILLPVDFAAILSAFIMAYALRVKFDVRPVAHPLGIIFFLKIFLLIIPFWILFFALSGLYNLSNLRGRLTEVGKIFVAVSAGVMFMIVIDFLSTEPLFPSKSVPIYAYGLSLVTVVVGRQIVRGVQRGLFGRGVGVHRVVIIGSGTIAQTIARNIQNSAASGYRIVGAIDTAAGAQKRMGHIRVDHNLTNLTNRLRDEGFDEFIQADSSLDPEEVVEIAKYAAANHLVYRFVPNQFGILATQADMGTLAGMPIVTMRRTPLEGWGRILKRLFDIAGSLLGLIILSPLFLILMIVIRVTDPGPAFYRHRRLSRSGKDIYVYKFRSMRTKFSTGGEYDGKSDADAFASLGRPDLIAEFAKEQKLKDDPRVSPIGRWLRKTSIDELPQLWNILRGDISWVGPRPIVEAELEKYGEGSALLALRPGLTGLWQVSGRNDIGYGERVKLDIFYIENWSLWLDIKIILRTVLIVLRGRGAY